jgi:hypothetical protein
VCAPRGRDYRESACALPETEPSSLIAVRDTPIDDLQLGDVVTYQLPPGEPALVIGWV